MLKRLCWLMASGLIATVSSAQTITIDEAIRRSLPLLQKTDATFIKKSGCVSCHHNSLTAMTISLARQKGFTVDEQVAREQRSAVGKYVEDWRERIQQGMGIPGLQDTMSYILIGLGAEKYPADAGTDAMAQFLETHQQPDGRWLIRADRPPLESSNVTVTATSLHALQLYAPKQEMDLYRLAVAKAAAWLSTASPRSNEEHAMRLIGLVWAGSDKDNLQGSLNALTSLQRSDGGWSQLPDMESDAYATGQALVALHEAGLPVKDAAYQRGVQFLLKKQLEDGSWFVKTRSIPIQPYFESDFPHGPDQWISVAATNWATMALIHAK